MGCVAVQVAIEVRGQPRVFKFDRVFNGRASQADVYEDTRPLVRSVLDGGGPPPCRPTPTTTTTTSAAEPPRAGAGALLLYSLASADQTAAGCGVASRGATCPARISPLQTAYAQCPDLAPRNLAHAGA